MRKTAILIGLIASAAGVLVTTMPAAAATGTTPATFQVLGGVLSITVPVAPVSLGVVTASTSAQAVSAQLGLVTVIDARGGITGWTATAGATDFVGPQTVSVSAAGSSSYTTPAATVVGVATVSSSNLTALSPAGPVHVATAVIGIDTASWNPTISVTIPANALAGTYNSVVTHSVA